MKFITPVLSLIIVVSITTFPGCFENITPTNLTNVPALTTDGRNAAGCLINGEPAFNYAEENVTAIWSKGRFSLYATFEPGFMEIHLYVPEMDVPHRVIDEFNQTDSAYFYFGACEYKFGSSGTPGNVCNVHLRRADTSVVSGTFSMTATDVCGSITVTQGRFDVETNPE